MVLRVDVVAAAFDAVYGGTPAHRVVALTPAGRQLDQELVEELATEPALTLLSARFEGFDQRILDHLCTDEVSIGPYVLSGGEIPGPGPRRRDRAAAPGSAHRGLRRGRELLGRARRRPRVPALHEAGRVPRLARARDPALRQSREDRRVEARAREERGVSGTDERERMQLDAADGSGSAWPGASTPAEPRETPPPQPPFSWPVEEERPSEHEFHHPLDRVTGRLPRRLRIAVDWIVTIVGAIAIVLAIKAFVINPYRIPSSSMEPTLHCARPAQGCEARFSDRVLANRFVYHFTDPRARRRRSSSRRRRRLAPSAARVARSSSGSSASPESACRSGCAAAPPSSTSTASGSTSRTSSTTGATSARRSRSGSRAATTSSWATTARSRATPACGASVPEDNLIGKVFMTYWPPNRISFR